MCQPVPAELLLSWPRWGRTSTPALSSQSPQGARRLCSLPSLRLESRNRRPPPLLEWGEKGPTDFPSARTEQQTTVITCREKVETSRNCSLLEMPTHDCSHPSFFQMFLTRRRSRCRGARQTEWGQDKEPPSSGTSFGSAHLTHPTSSTPGRKGGLSHAGGHREWASLPGTSSSIRRIKGPGFTCKLERETENQLHV